ncbi:MAG: sigma-54-dependent Fis family transcriptional regulator [Lentisphaerae bacterium]|nr:MAG: sigma-54-dependent Fis family transcriptional regulator [Lentisphaerota bacterium]
MTSEKLRIMVLDDEPAIVYALESLLENQGFEVVSEDDSGKALDLLQQQRFNLIITDIHMQPVDGYEIVRRVNAMPNPVPVIVVTGYASVESAIQAVEAGAFDYVTKPFKFDELIEIINHAMMAADSKGARETMEGIVPSRPPRYYYRSMVGDSFQMRHIFSLLEPWKQAPVPTIIQGEPGSGCSQLAWVMHWLVFESSKRFYRIPCEDPEERLIQQLIQLDMKEAGTLVLDHIEKLSLSTQQAILTFLEKNLQALTAWCLLSISRHDVRELVARNRFLEPLYYRLGGRIIEIPPLRKRMEDIQFLVSHFLNQLGKIQGKSFMISASVMNAFRHYEWPGNVAQLREVLQTAVQNCRDNMIRLEHLPADIAHNQQESQELFRWEGLRRFLLHREREFIRELTRHPSISPLEIADILAVPVNDVLEQLAEIENGDK